jgi:hypothetical protein
MPPLQMPPLRQLPHAMVEIPVVTDAATVSGGEATPWKQERKL